MKQKILSVGETGQILLVVILVVIIALTVGLSLASRTITNLRSATEEVESQKALAAAEAGIERAILGRVNITSVDLGNNSNYSASVDSLSEAEFLLNGGLSISKDEGTDIWFQAHDLATGDLTGSFVRPDNPKLYWGTAANSCGGDTPAAIQVIVVAVDSSGTIKTYRYAYDPCHVSRGNNFTATTAGSYSVGGSSFSNESPDDDLAEDVPAGENIIFMRVIPLYKDSIIGMTNGAISLPLQGYKIDSTGTSGEANRKIRVFKGWPQTYLPYLSYGLFVAKDN